MRRPPLTRKKIRVILDSLNLMGGCAGVDEPDWDCTGHTEQDRKDFQEAVDFMRQLSRWHNWKQEQKQEQNEQEIIDAALASMGINVKATIERT